MWKSMALSLLLLLLLPHLLVQASSLSAESKRSQWNTLTGSPPLVIANGGFSGMFPHSSDYAYRSAVDTSGPDVTLWCDVQLTKDQVGICLPSLNIDNCTFISDVFPNKNTSYLVNGISTPGYFSVDYALQDLSNVPLKQAVKSRLENFDNISPILTVESVAKSVAPQTPALWLNVQHDTFYRQHNLNMTNFILSVSRRVRASYISSPEVGFLRSIKPRFNPNTTKLVFRFLNQNDTDPSTIQTYGSLFKNLTFIKTFASGILVPKGYIWPVDASLYLQPHTSLVADAHQAGLEVFALDFANDYLLSYNYSYDPVSEYLQFIDNGHISVDGVLSDSPITASEAIGCFAHLGTDAKKREKTLIISNYGASGDYPACTDLAYNQAILDGVDVLDCPVQMSKDATPFCLSSIDILESTTVAQTSFINVAMNIPEIKSGLGIFTFDLMWTEIKRLSPYILNPFRNYKLFRNPKYKTAGTFLTLSDFISLTKNQTSLPGILIIVENAAYLADRKGYCVSDVVIDKLRRAGYDKPGSQKVYIQSTSSSVLLYFKERTNYELVYKIDEIVGDASDAVVEEIKNFAGSVVMNKKSVFPYNEGFLTNSTTRIVAKLKAANLSIFVETFSNEFVSQALDFFSDSTVVITDFPKTATRYTRNKCLNLSSKTPPYMRSVQAGNLSGLIDNQAKPPAMVPLPLLTESEVVEPPLPSCAHLDPPPRPHAENEQPKVSVYFLSNVAVIVAALFFFC